jgi:RNA polymerase sigma-70 factor (ECF subfamily)
MTQVDPLRDVKPLIERVYAYVAYRIPARADAEDVTSEVFERALRYRGSYDPSRGDPVAWLIGIARRCIDDWFRQHRSDVAYADYEGTSDATASAIDRMAIAQSLASLEPRDRDLIALRYGADLSTRQIASLMEMQSGAVDVALHRARTRLKEALREDAQGGRPRTADGLAR